MTNLSSTCPGCASPIETIDKFCQDCGLSLVARIVPLRSPLLGARDKDAPIPRGLSGTHKGRGNPEPPNAWLRGMLGAETVLVLAMFAYSGYAMFWLERQAPDLVRLQAQKTNGMVAQRNVIATCAVAAPDEVSQLIARAGLLSRLKNSSAAPAPSPSIEVPKTAVGRPERHHKTPTTAGGATWRIDDREIASGSVGGKAAHNSISETKLARHVPSAELTDVAQYNKLLAGYFSRHHEDAKEANDPGVSAEPPSFQEWVEGSKQIF